MPDERRWTIYVCEGCGYIGGPGDDDPPCECDRDKWGENPPEIREVTVAPVEEARPAVAGGLDGVSVACGVCEGQVFMLTCNHLHGTGHEWAVASICSGCRSCDWIESGCLDCQAAVSEGSSDE